MATIARQQRTRAATVLWALWMAFRQAGVPAVFFRLPSLGRIVVAAQTGGPGRSAAAPGPARGFVMAPFTCTSIRKASMIACDYYREFNDDFDDSSLQLPQPVEKLFRAFLNENDFPPESGMAGGPLVPLSAGRDRYVFLVNKAREEILSGRAEKIVVSHSHSAPLSEAFNIVDAFFSAAQAYPSAFVVLLSHAKFGTWLGASPEILLERTSETHWRTVALAGTKPLTDGSNPGAITWDHKEREEQGLVCKDIRTKLGSLHAVSFTEGACTTVAAGNMVHLKTVFDIEAGTGAVADLLDALHPTSAVSGMPGRQAAAFIAANEGLDRSLYAGYWGPLGLPCGTAMYVNIRCMRLSGREATMYAGAGITAESGAEEEWEEALLKCATMETLLR